MGPAVKCQIALHSLSHLSSHTWRSKVQDTISQYMGYHTYQGAFINTVWRNHHPNRRLIKVCSIYLIPYCYFHIQHNRIKLYILIRIYHNWSFYGCHNIVELSPFSCWVYQISNSKHHTLPGYLRAMVLLEARSN